MMRPLTKADQDFYTEAKLQERGKAYIAKVLSAKIAADLLPNLK